MHIVRFEIRVAIVHDTKRFKVDFSSIRYEKSSGETMAAGLLTSRIDLGQHRARVLFMNEQDAEGEASHRMILINADDDDDDQQASKQAPPD